MCKLIILSLAIFIKICSGQLNAISEPPLELIVSYYKFKYTMVEKYLFCDSTILGPTDVISNFTLGLNNSKNLVKYSEMLSGREDPRILSSISYRDRVGVFLDLNCQYGIEFLRKCSKEYLFTERYVWLIWNKNYGDALRLLDKINMSVDTDAALVDSTFDIYDVYKIHYSMSTISTKIASWSPVKGYMREKLPPCRDDLHGFSINISAVLPNLYFDENTTLEDYMDPLYLPQKAVVSREAFSLMMHLKEMLNITYKFHNSWGYEQTPGNFSGCVGAVISSESEMCVSGIQLRGDRLQYVDFLYTLRMARCSFSFLQPSSFGSFKALTDPLSGDVWAYLGLLTLLFIFAFRLLARFDSSPDINTWGNIIIYATGAIAQQGFEDTIKLASGRILSMSLLLMSFIVFTYYNASVLNALLSPSPNTIFTIKQLLDSKMKLGLLDVPYNKERTSNESLFGVKDDERDRLYQVFNKTSRLYYHHDEAIDRARRGGFAVYSLVESFYPRVKATYSDAEICSFYHVNRIPPFPLALAIRKHSPYTKLLRQAMFRMSQGGLNDRINKEWLVPKPRCQWRNEAISIGPESLAVAYTVLLVGIVASLCILAIEICYNKINGSSVHAVVSTKTNKSNTE